MADGIIGFFFGVLLTVFVAVHHRDQGRDECEQQLPRAEKCVHQWVPQPAKASSNG